MLYEKVIAQMPTANRHRIFLTEKVKTAMIFNRFP